MVPFFHLNKKLHNFFSPVIVITFAILLLTFLLTMADLTLAIQQNRRSVDQSRSKIKDVAECPELPTLLSKFQSYTLDYVSSGPSIPNTHSSRLSKGSVGLDFHSSTKEEQ